MGKRGTATLAILTSSALVLSMGAKGGCDSSSSHPLSSKKTGKRAAVSVGGSDNSKVRVSYLLDPHKGTQRLTVDLSHGGWVTPYVRITQHTVITVNVTVLKRGGVGICAIYVDGKRVARQTARGKGHIAYCKTNFVLSATIQGEL